ncbi:hypothetical protein EV644_1076 [Kribbella orskensis]|uniref:Uncharacterized protein n=1 Tax=Kribbella orskensis TaxID=2512216 RepID=A0ABY2BIG1_9ACTN|nr:hypothetical protein EV642_1076 [Kribbella sp. VKM Ac-2500]TCO21685.1 hypothetical protein EV644_1076 [Kribbella orskensis]
MSHHNGITDSGSRPAPSAPTIEAGKDGGESEVLADHDPDCAGSSLLVSLAEEERQYDDVVDIGDGEHAACLPQNTQVHCVAPLPAASGADNPTGSSLAFPMARIAGMPEPIEGSSVPRG